MTNRIYRSHSDRVIAGVCGGLARYLNVDVVIIRIVFMVLTLLNGLGALLYLALWLLLPAENSLSTDARSQVQENFGEMRQTAIDFVNRIRNSFRP